MAIFEYFVAEEAGGPGKPTATRSGFFRKRNDAPLPAGLPTVELSGAGPDDLADVVRRLSARARSARESGGRLYCWMET